MDDGGQAYCASEGDLHENDELYPEYDKREKFNMLFRGTNMSPLKSSTVIPLEEQSESSLRRLKAKYRRGVQSLKEEYAEAMAPNQGLKLISLVEEDSRNSFNDEDETRVTEMVDQLKLLYNTYVDHKVSFRERVQLVGFRELNFVRKMIFLS